MIKHIFIAAALVAATGVQAKEYINFASYDECSAVNWKMLRRDGFKQHVVSGHWPMLVYERNGKVYYFEAVYECNFLGHESRLTVETVEEFNVKITAMENARKDKEKFINDRLSKHGL